MPASTTLQPAQHVRTTTITASDVIKDFVLKAKTKDVQEKQGQGQKLGTKTRPKDLRPKPRTSESQYHSNNF